MTLSDWLVVTGLVIDILGVVSLTLSGAWWGTPNALNFVFMKRQVDRDGRGQNWLSAGFGFGADAWESRGHKAVYEEMRRKARWMLFWRWFSVAIIVVGFGMQITGQLLEANSS